MEEKELIEDAKKAQALNEALADTPTEVKIGDKTFKLHRFTIDRIVRIDAAILEISSIIDRYTQLRDQLESGDVTFDELRDDLISTGKGLADKLCEVLALILFDSSHPLDEAKEWVRNNVDLTPSGEGMKIIQLYQEKCSLAPFLRAVLSSKQF